MAISLEQLKKIIDDEFALQCNRFVSVSAVFEYNDPGNESSGIYGLSIRIGARDVTINEHGEVLDAGTFL